MTNEEAFGGLIEKLERRDKEFQARLLELEQRAASRPDPSWAGLGSSRTPGQIVANDADLAAWVKRGALGRERVQLGASVANLTGAPSGAAAAAVAPGRLPPVSMPFRRVRIRSLLRTVRTTSNSVEIPRQVGRQNMAAPVAEAALKPQSDMTLDLVEVKIRTLAHWIKASVQVLSDAPLLSALIDGELLGGLADVEDEQLLAGDGTGQNLLGLIPQATAFDTALILGDDSGVDLIRRASVQIAIADFEPSGVVLNPIDWARLETVKDANGRYIVGDPSGLRQPNLWSLPALVSSAMPEGHFMVGDFAAAAILLDREEANAVASTEDGDNFIKNMVTIRAEERLALAVVQPEALVYGSFD